ncbi:cryptochrome/photolyase family protein [Methylocapsa acidiphila]|uniref:cryptochrome/photolyase family protein n=1 Tax=Methylocapsa acidiphila TaxID=133552 RepID=UPI0003F4EB3D|nr:deoxyribodipyrimidine photo-lyase [Methylocapsa acidiphila]
MAKARDPAPAIIWFRDDLRLADNAALRAACETRAPVFCIYVFEDGGGMRPLGAASRWWLHHALAALSDGLAKIGGRLDLLRGDAEKLVPQLITEAGASALFITRRYGGAEIALDRRIEVAATSAGARVESFGGQLLREPEAVATKSGAYYRVYTPFWRAASALPDPGEPLDPPSALSTALYPGGGPARASLAALGLLPQGPDWAEGFRRAWTPGESGAQKRLSGFLAQGLATYGAARDELGRGATSRLSPHLRFGEISPRQIFHGVRRQQAQQPEAERGADKFRAELAWREFNYHVLYHRPDVATKNLQGRFDSLPWRDPPRAELDAWRMGQTGYPLVDAAMRELWTSGFMHNRARMVAASFLVKHLLCDWRVGEAWFWDTLCDADPANNPMNWQWAAGSGFDAAPFFRVFNPVLQGEKFDSTGAYVRRHVPELARLPEKWIHRPWEAPAHVLSAARLKLGETYPRPIVDHASARTRALEAFARIKR